MPIQLDVVHVNHLCPAHMIKMVKKKGYIGDDGMWYDADEEELKGDE